MALIPPFFIDCVVAVGFPDATGNAAYQATGFLYGHFRSAPDEKTKNYRIFLVTNRHVFDGKTDAFLRFNPAGAEPARQYELPLVDASGNRSWLTHADPDVDIAAIGINGEMLRDQGIRFNWFRSDEHTVPRAKAIDLGVSEGDGVFVLGFPLGLVGEGRNFVILRQGSIARIRDCLEGNRKDFLIDCSVFPGNSGGPVVMRPELTSIQGTTAITAAYLIGVVAGYVPYQDVAVSKQTGLPRIVFEENSGLASVYPVDYVEEVIAAVIESTAPTEETPAGGADA